MQLPISWYTCITYGISLPALTVGRSLYKHLNTVYEIKHLLFCISKLTQLITSNCNYRGAIKAMFAVINEVCLGFLFNKRKWQWRKFDLIGLTQSRGRGSIVMAASKSFLNKRKLHANDRPAWEHSIFVKIINCHGLRSNLNTIKCAENTRTTKSILYQTSRLD
jgi:hypothetical protein